MKIGIVLSNPPQVSETFLNSFIEILSEKHNLTLFVAHKSYSLSSKIAQKQYVGLKWSSFLKSPGILILFLVNLKRYRYLRGYKVSNKQLLSDIYVWTSRNLDYIHFGFGNLMLGREYYGKAMGSKISVSFRGSDINVYPVWHNKSYELALNLADKVQANSNELVEKLKWHYADIHSKSTVIHPGLQRKYATIKEDIQKYIEKRGQNKKVQFVSVGRLHWIKGYEKVLAALSLLKKNGYDFHYTIIGSGAESEKLSFLVDFYGLVKNVDFVSNKNAGEIKEILRNSNLFIQTSWAEGFSNSTLEAQALGLPVVVTPVSGMSSIVQHKKTGYITKDFSIEEVLNGLDWFKGLPMEDIEEISLVASEYVQEKFSFSILKKNWIQFFN